MEVHGGLNGDECRIGDFPAPFNQLYGMTQGPNISEFRWAYADKLYGKLQIQVGSDGNGHFNFGYDNGIQRRDKRLAAMVLLLDEQRNELGRVKSVGFVHAGRGIWQKELKSGSADFWTKVKYLKFYHHTYMSTDEQNAWNFLADGTTPTKNTTDVAPPPPPQAIAVISVECINRSSSSVGNYSTGRAEQSGAGPNCQAAMQDALNKVDDMNAFCRQRMQNQAFTSNGSRWVRTGTCG